MTIVVADDSALARMFIIRCLEMAGVYESTFIEAKDGIEALEKVKTNSPDLLITDLNMPNMDGEDLLATLQADASISVKVIVISSAGDTNRKERLTTMGASAVLPKPVSPAILADCLRSLTLLED
jgi:two-component system, chemotaxis family, chemotaxis protein CheY